jgi:DNA-directed RNA polymerase subunit RPC12/RpoP
MWIQLDCPNGHPLKVDVKFAGKLGRCPACGVKVRIPQPSPAEPDMSEEHILDLIGPAAEPPPPVFDEPLPVHEQSQAQPEGDLGSAILRGGGSAVLAGAAALKQPMRVCPACKRKVSLRYTICPHCRTYLPIAGVAEIANTRSANCPQCGAKSFPGAAVCHNCGEPLE